MLRGGQALVAVMLAAAVAAPACGLLHHRHAATAPIDLNRAAVRKVEKLPGITPSMAQRIVDGRPYEEPHDLVARGILTEREFDRIADLVIVEHRGH
jgi:predicted DNA-binding helix-hairpin-helix protein